MITIEVRGNPTCQFPTAFVVSAAGSMPIAKGFDARDAATGAARELRRLAELADSLHKPESMR